MVRKNSRANYTGISMPKELMDAVEDYRKKHPAKQYRSNAEFVKEAIREKLDAEEYTDRYNKWNYKEKGFAIDPEQYFNNPIFRNKIEKEMDKKFIKPKKRLEHLKEDEKLDLIIELLREIKFPPNRFHKQK